MESSGTLGTEGMPGPPVEGPLELGEEAGGGLWASREGRQSQVLPCLCGPAEDSLTSAWPLASADGVVGPEPEPGRVIRGGKW